LLLNIQHHFDLAYSSVDPDSTITDRRNSDSSVSVLETLQQSISSVSSDIYSKVPLDGAGDIIRLL
jgi:hypothetical protein